MLFVAGWVILFTVDDHIRWDGWAMCLGLGRRGPSVEPAVPLWREGRQRAQGRGNRSRVLRRARALARRSAAPLKQRSGRRACPRAQAPLRDLLRHKNSNGTRAIYRGRVNDKRRELLRARPEARHGSNEEAMERSAAWQRLTTEAAEATRLQGISRSRQQAATARALMVRKGRRFESGRGLSRTRWKRQGSSFKNVSSLRTRAAMEASGSTSRRGDCCRAVRTAARGRGVRHV